MSPFTESERRGLERTKQYSEQGTAYYAVQSTQPQTLGYSLADSPVGLLAWIYEKLVAWTDDYPWTDDESEYFQNVSCSLSKPNLLYLVLAWVSIYWFSRPGPAASVRIYHEAFADGQAFARPYIHVPTGISIFPKEVLCYPKL